MIRIFTNLDERYEKLLQSLNEYVEYETVTEQSDCDVALIRGAITTKAPHTIYVLSDNELDVSHLTESDDFVCEPFTSAELHARILRLIAPVNRVLDYGELKLDVTHAKVFINDTRVHLTLIEYKLLSLLASNRGKCVTYKEILNTLWDPPIGNEMRSVRVFINAIRSKFSLAGAIEEHIITYAAKGYELK